MTTTFFLVRHAAHDRLGSYLAGRIEGISLGPDGLQQAGRLADRMRKERFAAVVSSPRERTRQTAEAISTACNVGPVEISDDLDEIDFGEWSGRGFDDLNRDPAWRRWNEARAEAATPAGETMEDVRRRIWGRMETLARRHEGEGVVIVSHADVIKSTVCHVLGLPADACFRFEIEPASVTVVTTDAGNARLQRLNEGV